jgi:hypothetical protein
MVINIEPHHFGGPMRNGDIIGALNFLEFLRRKDNQIYKFYIPDESIQPQEYIRKFRDWLTENTDYISKEPGGGRLDANNINLWDFRSITGDILELNFNRPQKKKICVVPVFDAPYNGYRNWSVEMFESILNHYSQEQYDDYEKVVCVNKIDFFSTKWEYSYDFMENIEHIVECSHYVGGDTGTSHFASVLPKKDKLNYYYGSVGLLHTTPFYALQGKGNINLFWNNNWRTDLL